jgi:CheY-like chemotaxis protein
MNVLIRQGRTRIAAFVERGLKAEGFAVQVAPDGETGHALACQEETDLILLDRMLPGLSGEQVLQRVRARRPDLPVIVLTARDAVEDRVRNLNAGADDYVTKPFSFAELLARVHARLRARDQRSATELELVQWFEELELQFAGPGSGGAVVRILPPPPLTIDVDPDRLAQAVLNLVNNAQVHTPPDTNIEVRAVAGGDHVAIEVADDGPGIP